MTPNRQLALYGLAIAAALLLSGWQPYDRATWLLEVFPVLIALPVIAFTRGRFPLTPLLAFLIFLHMLVLIYGGAYTYARVPLGFWMQELLGGRYDTPLGPIRFRADGEVVQGRFYVAEVRMQPDGRQGRFTLVRDFNLDTPSR